MINERLKAIRQALGMNQSVFAESIGLKQGSYSDMESGKTKSITKQTIMLVSMIHNINIDYLYEKSEDMYRNSINEIFHSKSNEKIYDEQSIYFYDIEAAANLKTLLANKDQNIIGQIMIPEIPKCDGAVRVKGDSMYPLLKSGDIIAYKEVPADIMHIYWGEMYMVSIDMDGEEYLTVKYIQQSDKGEDWIKLVSYNQHHQPKDFPITSIRAIALVKFSIRLNTMK